MLKAACVVVAVALPSASWAACDTDMLEGKWTAEISVQSAKGEEGVTEVICNELRFDKKGNLKSTSCLEDGGSASTEFVGQLSVDKKCAFKGSFRIFIGGKKQDAVAEFNGYIDSLGNLMFSTLTTSPSNYYKFTQSQITAVRKD